MGRNWKFWTFIALLTVAHFFLHIALGLSARMVPDLLTIAVLLAARRLSPGGAAGVGLVLGLLQDALSLVAFGAAAITNTVLGYLGARSRDLFVGDSLLFVALYLFLGKWLHDALFLLLARRTVGAPAGDVLLLRAPMAALYAAVVGLILLLLYRFLARER